MSLPSIPTSFANVRAGARTNVQFPFIEFGDSTTKVYTMRCSVSVANYNASQVSLDAAMTNAAAAGVISLPFPADPAAYYCGDFNHNISDGGMMQFDRVFANIPADRTEQFGGQTSYTFPSVHGSLANGTTISIHNAVEVSYNGVTRVKLYTSDTIPYISGGDVVYLDLTMGSDVFQGYVTYSSKGTDNGGDYLLVTDFEPRSSAQSLNWILASGFWADSGVWADEASWGIGTLTVPESVTRVGVTTNVTAFEDHTFYLPNVTAGISGVEDIPDVEIFYVFVNRTQRRTDRIFDSQTTPSAGDYENLITNGDYLVIKNEIRRYKGNIMERIVTKVRPR